MENVGGDAIFDYLSLSLPFVTLVDRRNSLTLTVREFRSNSQNLPDMEAK